MLKDKSKLWTGAAVPYEFAKSVWSSPAREYETMIEAMEEIMQETCLRFKERSGEEDFVRIDFQGAKDYHMSYDGRCGGEQPISLFHQEYEKPAFLHEMGHTIGLKHEHQRPDRDHYIEIIHENLVSSSA
ncbi:astacin-like metalloprotease toxin 5 [Bemisia tabaci]|uniref:astacin-like metalloprotease toxin 5 n=1 Tax=Bemisia tabaci TaxID=7038 RepID=UPI003B284629